MAPPPKCYITTSDVSLDDKILGHHFNHQVDLLLPSECYTLISTRLDAALKPCSYRRLHMPLGAILEPEFFNTYIKTGNILLLSSGRIDIDNVFCLVDGVLRMSLSKEAYEKAGLVGRQSRFGKGLAIKRARWLVELDLRSPAYMTNSKSFNRLSSACSRVFARPTTFLFADVSSPAVPAPKIPLFSSPPREVTPSASPVHLLKIPTFSSPENARMHGGGKDPEAQYHREIWKEWAGEVYEWLALAALLADRLKVGGEVDPLLSTYAVEDARVGGVVRLRWKGMVPARWITGLWKTVRELMEEVEARGELDEKSSWAALMVHGFENSIVCWGEKVHGALGGGENGITVLRLPKRKDNETGPEAGVGKVDRMETMVFELVAGQDEYT